MAIYNIDSYSIRMRSRRSAAAFNARGLPSHGSVSEAGAYSCYAQFSRTSCRWRPQSRCRDHHEQAPRLG
jgi:hypothetical protein